MSGAAAGGAASRPSEARLIVAMTKERLIGRANDLPWHLPEDLAHFKRSTLGATVIMGRRSFESLGRPLPRRTNVVVSAGVAVSAGAGPDGLPRNGARWFPDLSAACAWVGRARPDGEALPWILGGATIFRQVLEPLERGAGAHARLGLPRPVELVVTWVPSQPLQEGDVLFPFDEAWIERHYDAVERRAAATPGMEFVTYRLRER